MHYNPMQRSRRGFTLVELLVALSIVAVLISIMLPSFVRVREDARRTICVSNQKSIGVGLFTYSADNRDNGPQVMPRMGSTSPRTLLSRSGKPVNLGLLRNDSIADPKIFLCPSQKKFNFRPLMNELDTHTIGGSYAYAVHLPAQENPRFGAIRHLSMVSDDFVARLGDVGIGEKSHRRGYNVLYTDGSASWYSDPDESVWKRSVHWDDERDDINYNSLYDPDIEIDEGQYGDALDIFRVWHAFCYSRPDVYPDVSSAN
jgi:prepilin-type N-terminal cleavage/methylation domain-containing protein